MEGYRSTEEGDDHKWAMFVRGEREKIKRIVRKGEKRAGDRRGRGGERGKGGAWDEIANSLRTNQGAGVGNNTREGFSQA